MDLKSLAPRARNDLFKLLDYTNRPDVLEKAIAERRVNGGVSLWSGGGATQGCIIGLLGHATGQDYGELRSKVFKDMLPQLVPLELFICNVEPNTEPEDLRLVALRQWIAEWRTTRLRNLESDPGRMRAAVERLIEESKGAVVSLLAVASTLLFWR